MIYNYEKVLEFLKVLIQQAEEKQKYYNETNYGIVRISSIDFEVMMGILFGEKKGKNRQDLENHEVKSLEENGQAVWDFHIKNGLNKLIKLMTVSHIFVIYSNEYNMSFFLISGEELTPKFEEWRSKVTANLGINRSHGYISSDWIKEYGTLIMKIENEEIVYSYK